jgi:hypothetical protein
MAKLNSAKTTVPAGLKAIAKATAPQPLDKSKLSPGAASRIRAKASRILGI